MGGTGITNTASIILTRRTSLLNPRYFLRKGNRPQLVQDMIDMRKRMRPAPTSGRVSIVVTDVMGFTDMMKAMPDLAMNALLIHNNLIQKAKNTNFGHVVVQEGGAYHARHTRQRSQICIRTRCEGSSFPDVVACRFLFHCV